MIRLVDVSKDYIISKKAGVSIPALKSVSLEFSGFGFVTVTGKSGSGKTTLLNILGGLDAPTSGAVEFNGRSLWALRAFELDCLRAVSIGYVFQDYNLLNDYSVSENVKLAVKFQTGDKNEIERRATEALKTVGLGDLGGRKISQLSGGQQQRVAIARVLAQNAPVIICDEPTGNLDSKTALEITEILKDMSKEKLVIVVTHDEETVNNYADRVIRLKDGEVVEDTVVKRFHAAAGASSGNTANAAVNAAEPSTDDAVNAGAEVAVDAIKLSTDIAEDAGAEITANAADCRVTDIITADAASDKKAPPDKNTALGDTEKPGKRKGGFAVKYRRLSLRDTLIMVGKNLCNTKIAGLMILILSIAAFSLFTVFYSLSNYNSQSAFVETLKHNRQYVFTVTKYIDSSGTEQTVAGEVFVYGPQIYYEAVRIEDIAGLDKLVDGKAEFYPSYFFGKNFQDFFPNFIAAADTGFEYNISGFREVIAVADFSKFNMPLLYGRFPRAANEILIYDYAAACMLEHGLLRGQISDAVGAEFTDTDTGFKMKISGVLESDYERYSYIKYKKDNYDFEETYLTSLQTVYAMPSFIDLLEAERPYQSVLKLYAVSEQGLTDIAAKKIKYSAIAPAAKNIFAAIENYGDTEGVWLTKRQLADILGVKSEDLTLQAAEDFLNDGFIGADRYYYDWSIEKSLPFSSGFTVLGVVDGADGYSDGAINFFTAEPIPFSNAAFRQIYISLGKDWKINEKILSLFVWSDGRDERFYRENPDYIKVGYTDYTAVGILIRDADDYISTVRSFADDITLITAIAAMLGIVLFTAGAIKKNSYKIGVLKSLGAGNLDITFVFGLEIVLIFLAAFAVSIGISFLLMSRINSEFTGVFKSDLVFFAIKPIYLLSVFSISASAVIVATLIPLIRLYLTAPMSIIKNNRK
jgi:ABC-type lipoprotein export system ATPase subunit